MTLGELQYLQFRLKCSSSVVCKESIISWKLWMLIHGNLAIQLYDPFLNLSPHPAVPDWYGILVSVFFLPIVYFTCVLTSHEFSGRPTASMIKGNAVKTAICSDLWKTKTSIVFCIFPSDPHRLSTAQVWFNIVGNNCCIWLFRRYVIVLSHSPVSQLLLFWNSTLDFDYLNKHNNGFGKFVFGTVH